MIEEPFIGSEALSAGLISERSMRRLCTPVYPNVYAERDAVLTPKQRGRAAWLWSKRRGVVAGLSASAMLGAKWIDTSEAAELIHDNRRPPPNLIVRRGRVLADEIVELSGMRTTSAARTAFDIGRRTTSRLVAVQRLDAVTQSHSRG